MKPLNTHKPKLLALGVCLFPTIAFTQGTEDLSYDCFKLDYINLGVDETGGRGPFYKNVDNGDGYGFGLSSPVNEALFLLADYSDTESDFEQLRIMTYNVHSCVGIDGKLATERIARVIAWAHPDVVALQELDVDCLRTASEDQAEVIARYLKMDYYFHPLMQVEEEKYGDAILTHLPMKVVKAGSLSGQTPGGTMEPRGALWVTVDLHGLGVNIVNTHLGLTPRERMVQVETLLGTQWLGPHLEDEPVILCGDFNSVPSSLCDRQLRSRFLDAQSQLDDHRPVCTFYSSLPSFRIDHIFINAGIRVSGITVPCSELAAVASDHLPLIADLHIPVKYASSGKNRHQDNAGPAPGSIGFS